MKKIIFPTLFLTLCLSISLFSTSVFAAEPTETAPTPTIPAPTLPPPNPADTVKFEQIGAGDNILQGPFQSVSLVFNLPPDWKPQAGAELRLHVSTSLSVVMFTQNQFDMESMVAGGLGVYINGAQLSNTQLHGNSDQTLQLQIPQNALLTAQDGMINELKITWNARSACSYNLASSVQIHPDSLFLIPHEIIPVPTSLAQFPSPIYLQNQVDPAGIVVLIPDQPSQGELQGAIRIAAGLGRLTAGKGVVSLLPKSKTDEKVLKANHVIAVGKTGGFDFIKDLPQAALPDEGIVRLTVSPWNPSRALLVVSGGNDSAVGKAALTVSSGKLLASTSDNISLVRDVVPAAAPSAFREDLAFGELGQEKITFSTFGSSKYDLNFFIPPGLTINPEAYLELSFNHSELIDYLGSGIVVRLNGIPIGSARLSDATAPASRARMIIPVSALNAGNNTVQIQVDIQPRNVCADPTSESLWITVFPDSVLHLPLDNQAASVPLEQKISTFPLPFVSNSELAETAIVVSSAFPAGWDAAARTAFYLGAQTRGNLSSVEVDFANAVPQTTLENKHLLLIGRPSQLPVLASLASGLPAVFGPGDEISPAVKTRISYNFPAGADLGYLEIAGSPLGAEKTIFLLLGSTDKGLKAAADALLNPASRAKLGGNFAIVQGKKVTLQDTSVEAGPEGPAVPGQASGTPAVKGTAAAPGATSNLTLSGRPVWLLPSLILAVLLILLLAGWQLAKFFRPGK